MSRSISSIAIVVGSVITICGCAAVSGYDQSDDVVPILFKRLECELYKARAPERSGKKTLLSSDHWEVFGQLTVVVDVNGSAGSKPSFTNKFADGSITWAGSPSIKVGKMKTFTYYFKINLDRVDKEDCKIDSGNELTLRGDLGVFDAVTLASTIREAGKFSDIEDYHSNVDALFSHDVRFTITKGVDGVGPSWVLGNFSGIGAALGASRGDTNELLVAFRKIPPAKAGAASKATFGVSHTDMLILNNLRGTRLQDF